MNLTRLLFALLIVASEIFASPFAIGYQRESWSDVEFSPSTNPSRPIQKGVGFNNIRFNIDGINTWYLEEPGLIFGAFSAIANTEGNRAKAREKAIKDNKSYYTYEYASPPPLTTTKWYRWMYSTGQVKGADVFQQDNLYLNGAAQLVGDTMVWKRDSTLTVDYFRFQMEIMMTPYLWGAGVYFIPSFVIGFTQIYYYDASSPTLQSGNKKNGDDFGYMTTPMNFLLGWQVPFFPYLSIEGQAGWDWINWALSAIIGLKDYEHGWNLGGRAVLGTDWIQAYYGYRYEVEPQYNGTDRDEAYHRTYKGVKDYMGIRLDLGSLIYRLFIEE